MQFLKSVNLAKKRVRNNWWEHERGERIEIEAIAGRSTQAGAAFFPDCAQILWEYCGQTCYSDTCRGRAQASPASQSSQERGVVQSCSCDALSVVDRNRSWHVR